MTTHHSLATWTHEGSQYTVTLAIQDGKPYGLEIDATSSKGNRNALLPTDLGTVEELAEVWNTSRPLDKLTLSAERALILAWRIGQGYYIGPDPF